MRANQTPRRQVRAGRDRWLVSYADLVTLLFATFAVLFASSLRVLRPPQPPRGEKNPQPSARVAEAAPTSRTDANLARSSLPPVEVADNTFVALETELRSKLEPELNRGEFAILQTREGLVISLREIGIFKSGRSQLMPGAAAKLQSVAATVSRKPFRLRIEGHSDDRPIHNAIFRSNWDLSTARAEAVLHVLLAVSHTDPATISVAGYGPYHPVADNATPRGRAENRRVDIVVVRP